MQKILEKFKAFNKKHRKLLPFIVYPEIAVIVILSLFGYLKRHLKVVIPVLLVICLVAVAAKCAADSGSRQSGKSGIETDSHSGPEAGESSPEIFEEVNESEPKAESEEENTDTGNSETADVADEEVKSEEEKSTDAGNLETADVVDEEVKSEEENTDTGNLETADVDDGEVKSEEDKSTDTGNVETADAVYEEVKSEEENTDAGNLEAENAASIEQEAASESDASKEPDTSADLSEINEKAALLQEKLVELKEEYPETAAWIWFEDDLISQPVMQAGDNQKYADLDNTGTEADTGSIFFDYRSKTDLSDPNTIIYGHNMRDYTMFGAFKYYKNNNDFLKDHKYIRIITPDNIYRYMIFAYMGVPENSEIYNVCGDSSDKMRQFLDTIEYRTYIDTGIEPSVDDKIITLSTCTKSDQLNFIMFAVRVGEQG